MDRINELLFGAIAFAQDKPGLVPCDGSEALPCNYNAFILLIGKIFGYLTAIAVPFATAVIVYGGVMMVTAGSNDSKRSTAKGIIWKAVWGLVITLAAYVIVKTIYSQLVDTAKFPLLF